MYSSIIKPTSLNPLAKVLSEYLHKKLWNTFPFWMYLVRVSLFIVKPNVLRYSIHVVKESKFNVCSLMSAEGSTKLFPFE